MSDTHTVFTCLIDYLDYEGLIQLRSTCRNMWAILPCSLMVDLAAGAIERINRFMLKCIKANYYSVTDDAMLRAVVYKELGFLPLGGANPIVIHDNKTRIIRDMRPKGIRRLKSVRAQSYISAGGADDRIYRILLTYITPLDAIILSKTCTSLNQLLTPKIVDKYVSAMRKQTGFLDYIENWTTLESRYDRFMIAGGFALSILTDRLWDGQDIDVFNQHGDIPLREIAGTTLTSFDDSIEVGQSYSSFSVAEYVLLPETRKVQFIFKTIDKQNVRDSVLLSEFDISVCRVGLRYNHRYELIVLNIEDIITMSGYYTVSNKSRLDKYRSRGYTLIPQPVPALEEPLTDIDRHVKELLIHKKEAYGGLCEYIDNAILRARTLFYEDSPILEMSLDRL